MDIKWMISRLKAMNVQEVAWRIGQRRLSRKEAKTFADKVAIIDRCFNLCANTLSADYSLLGIVKDNTEYSIEPRIELLADYDYEIYKTKWHAGFQSDGQWGLVPSNNLNAAGPEAPGDLRTNWELNRHHQFVVIAKCYYITDDSSYLEELINLFYDWNKANPFLWGPEWTSPMEMGIRLINWLYAAAFLVENENAKSLVRDMEIGCINMADYIVRHRSRFSSANNHSIVEAVAVGIAGYVFNNKEWQDVAFAVLDAEILNQNHPDGVNKEQALHYQTFGMEAYALYLHVRVTKGDGIPEGWKAILSSSCDYVSDCRVKECTYIEFGDDDEGVILNMCSKKPCHPEYVLALYGLLLDVDRSWCGPCYKNETLCWLFPLGKIDRLETMPTREPLTDALYPAGGISIVRFGEKSVCAIDHGPLGFGPLYAHGHADALSFQLYLWGRAAIVDPGTFIYNGNTLARNSFRSTRRHNTVCVNGENQSRIAGPFLWSDACSAKCIESGACYRVVEADYCSGVRVRRTFKFVENGLCLTDEITGLNSQSEIVDSFHFAPGYSVAVLPGKAVATSDNTSIELLVDGGLLNVEEYDFSSRYGICQKADCLMIQVENQAGTSALLEVRISFNEGGIDAVLDGSD